MEEKRLPFTYGDYDHVQKVPERIEIFNFHLFQFKKFFNQVIDDKYSKYKFATYNKINGILLFFFVNFVL